MFMLFNFRRITYYYITSTKQKFREFINDIKSNQKLVTDTDQ